jgi:hypothetical protein
MVATIIDNATRLRQFYTSHPSGNLTSASTALLDDWRRRADNPESLITHTRNFFRLPKATPMGTFLIATGIFPEPHFDGCYLAPRKLVRADHS